MWRDLRDFFQAVFSGWLAQMAGLFSVLTTIAIYVTGWQSLPLRLFLFLCILGLLLAFFLAWRREHSALASERAVRERLERASAPDLSGSVILQTATFNMDETYPDGSRSKMAGALFVIEIRNLGADSVVDYWAAWATLDGHRFRAALRQIPDRMEMPNGATYYNKDAIYEKTATEPIKRGAKAVGILFVAFPHMTLEGVQASSIEVEFKDIVGRSYTITQKSHDAGIGHYPGMTPPLPQPNVTPANRVAPVLMRMPRGACACGSGLPFEECHGQVPE